MDSECSGGSNLPAVDSAGERCRASSCPCCSGGATSSAPGAATLQQRQKEETMAAAVEAVLREIGEDPNREARSFLCYFKIEDLLQTILPSCHALADYSCKLRGKESCSGSIPRCQCPRTIQSCSQTTRRPRLKMCIAAFALIVLLVDAMILTDDSRVEVDAHLRMPH